jgi:protein O-GlcNAc transferase
MSSATEELATQIARIATAINSENYVDAQTFCSELAQLAPEHPQLHYFQGAIASGLGQLDDAILHMEKALELSPDDWKEPCFYLGQLYRRKGQQQKAIEYLGQATQYRPDNPEAWFELSQCYLDVGQLQTAYPLLQEALARDPDNAHYQDTFLFYTTAMPSLQDTQRKQLFQRWGRYFADPLTPSNPVYANSPVTHRKLRIGYVSADFRHHAAAHNLKALFQNHDHERFEIYAYVLNMMPDKMTDWFQNQSDYWREIQHLNQSELANLIRTEQIDILVDCSGHSSGNRLLAFAHKPAPIQISAFGFIFTTGMKAMDYQVSDPVSTPAHRFSPYVETILHLPTQIFWEPLTPSIAEMPIALPPHTQNGYITFGSANGSFKHNEYVIKLWAAILKQVPQSRLHFKHMRFGDVGVQALFRQAFQKEGIAVERILFTGHTSTLEHIEFQQQIDIALDPFPYTGCMTLCETSYMGVPTIALDGDGIRTSQSLLTLMGAPELIAKTPEEYVFKAVALAKNPQRIADYRSRLRSQMQASPIMDAPAFARSMEAAYRMVWEKWCLSQN